MRSSSPLLSSKHPYSLLAWWLAAALIVLSAFFYYPKWQEKGTEATLSWDVSGYYFYLPAALIYHDIKDLGFRDSILQKYQPTPQLQQAFRHEASGHFVLKYSCGQALQMLPWFAVAHVLARPLGFPADGFSLPYQFAISMGSLLVALLGLWYLRRSLLLYFNDAVVGIVLFCLVFGSNYLNYTAFDGAMTHNWLFTLYSLLIWHTTCFYRAPRWQTALIIGILTGWAVLTRPTEILCVCIPLLWGMDQVSTRGRFWVQHWRLILLAGVAAAAVISIQLLYWRYVSGEWVVYSYQDQGFDWLRPHILDGMFSFKSGWLTYSPMLAFAVLGLWPLWRQHRQLFVGVAVFSLLFMYVTWAWSIWWYGGSLGQRAMVQSYPVWAFAFAAFVSQVVRWRWGRLVFPLLAGFFIWHNLFWTHQAHRGGLYITEQMTKYYWLAAWGRSELPRSALKLLDTKDEHYSKPAGGTWAKLYETGFETDTLAITEERPISGKRSLLLRGDRQWSAEHLVALPQGSRFVRAHCSFHCTQKEWEWWRMTQFIVRCYAGDKMLKDRMIRLQRHVEGSEQQRMFFDTKLPAGCTKVGILFWNADGPESIRIDDVLVEVM